MAKFNPGERAHLSTTKESLSTELAIQLYNKYNNTDVIVVVFHGCFMSSDNKFMDQGDWYEVEGFDKKVFYARESALHKFPEHDSTEAFWSHIGYKIPSRTSKVVHAKQIQAYVRGGPRILCYG